MMMKPFFARPVRATLGAAAIAGVLACAAISPAAAQTPPPLRVRLNADIRSTDPGVNRDANTDCERHRDGNPNRNRNGFSDPDSNRDSNSVVNKYAYGQCNGDEHSITHCNRKCNGNAYR